MQPRDPATADLLAALSEGVAIFDAEGRLAAVNSAFREANSTMDAFLRDGTSWDLFLREAERQVGFPGEVCTQLRQIESSLLDNFELSDPIEAVLPVGRNYSFRLGALSDGGFVLVQTPAGRSHDDTDAVRDAEALLRKVLEASPISLTMSRIGDGHVIYRSPAATELLGTAKSSFAHFAHRTERADFITALLPDERVDDMRITGLRADGREFPARLSARLIDYGGEDVIVSSMEDLTEKIAIEAELARNREQLFQAEKMSAMGELLAGVAHELNNPLSIIVGNAGLLRQDLEGTEHVQRIEKLMSAAERSVGIVRSFLSMARERPLDLSPVPFGEIVEVAIEAITGLAATASVVLEIEADAQLPHLAADKVQIAQVLINLFTNSIHAIQDSGTGSRVALRAAAKADRVVVTVADDGPGIDEAIRGKIFDPLFTTKEPGRGTGVGLAFCMRVVKSHEGSITLEPPSGPGTTFTVDLPAAT
jgi:PAS domain S-box-containing protein